MRHWCGPRRKLSAEETAANAARKAERERRAMHCQICGRAILANSGKIAHHGYQRPGHGWQTASCFGAKEPPFEADRAALARFIGYLKDQHGRMVKDRADANAEKLPVVLYYKEWKRTADRYGGGKYVDKNFEVTRVSFEAVKVEQEAAYHERNPNMSGTLFRSQGWENFDHVKKIDLNDRTAKIGYILRDIAEFEKRYAGWKKTHEWSEQTWQEVAR